MIEKKGKGKGRIRCVECGNADAVIKKYGLNICRRCFKDNALMMGFKKYN
ncbi:MAG: 30S ribosomal protein S14 [Candidatus Diapherotrites archaeon]|nr:30S ribosomal protein S14 [Candidatus Diapherotrites archaeon]